MEDKKKILIIEDDLLIQMVYKALFVKDYSIKICSSDIEFYEAIKDQVYDLFIVDLSLQCEKDGIQLLKEIRQMEQYISTPVLVVTAFAYAEDKTAALKAGANLFLPKPVTNQVLKETVSSLLYNKAV